MRNFYSRRFKYSNPKESLIFQAESTNVFLDRIISYRGRLLKKHVTELLLNSFGSRFGSVCNVVNGSIDDN